MKKDPNISKNRTTDFKSSEQNNEISLKETSFKINGFNIIELNEDEEDNQSDLNLEDEEINNLKEFSYLENIIIHLYKKNYKDI